MTFGYKHNLDSSIPLELGEIIEKLTPVMRFIAYGLQASGSCGPSQIRDWQYEYYNIKSIILVDRGGKVLGDRYFRGYYEGSALILLRTGQLPGWTSMGRWSRWQE